MRFPIETSSAEVLATEAEKRGITVERIYDIRPGFIRLTFGEHREYMFQSQSDQLGRVSARIFSHKVFTTRLLAEAGFPVPEDFHAKTIEEALTFLAEHNPMVIKPINATGGKAVKMDITNEDIAREAFAEAFANNEDDVKGVVCQEQIDGRDYRILVVNQKDVFTVERVPAFVTGDGERTVQELLNAKNKEAVAGYEIPLNDIAPIMLAKQDLTLDSVPNSDRHVRLMQAANSHLGGTVVDADKEIGDAVKEEALRLAKYFDLSIIGIDCLSKNISESIGKIIELNPAPALYKHVYPDVGDTQPATAAVIDMVFPETARQ